jgi:hypothetical protein
MNSQLITEVVVTCGLVCTIADGIVDGRLVWGKGGMMIGMGIPKYSEIVSFEVLTAKV